MSTSPATYAVAKRNVLKTMITVSGCFVLCFSCNEFMYLLYYLGVQIDFSGPLYHCSVVAVFFNCCLNPLIYAVRYNEFKKGLKLFFNRSGWPNLIGTISESTVQNVTPNVQEHWA
jgi:hypothetical protein